ncbi:MAG TPA: hypothetical protein VFD58_08980 [Blastocatellia bacterium]|nr:hypothetical protein [Blastocatellia bacterium]
MDQTELLSKERGKHIRHFLDCGGINLWQILCGRMGSNASVFGRDKLHRRRLTLMQGQ